MFICDFVVIAKICQANFFMMYYNHATPYQHEHFQLFCDVVENDFATITQDWVTNLKNGSKYFFNDWS